MKDIRSILNRLADRIDRWYPTVNSGGCCVLAVIIAQELRKRNIPVEIIVAADGASENIDRAREKVKSNRKHEWNSAGVYFNHVGIEFRLGDDVYHFDTEGRVKPEDFMLGTREIYEGRLTVEEAKELADEAEGWNPVFDRKTIPSLRRHVKRYLAINMPLTATA